MTENEPTAARCYSTKTTDESFPIPAHKRIKRCSFDFYEKTLGAPKYVVAPMVDQSELAWRLLSRRHGAQLSYSPMFHSNVFSQDPKYREQALQSCPEDRPLIIQFCGNDPKTLLAAAVLAQDYCDAIDINLGCPQLIAKRGHYGAFLQDEWDLLADIVKTLHENLSVPVTCKIRRFDDVEKTIRYAKMLVDAGCQMLTVHGRTRDQKGPLTDVADWSYVRAVRENVPIPILANGNIMSIEDVDRCLEETGANGVMTAEGNLHNPALFERNHLPLTWTMAEEYLDLVEQYPCPNSYIRGHLFKIFHHLLNLKCNETIRLDIATSQNVEQFRRGVHDLRKAFEPFHRGEKVFIDTEDETSEERRKPENDYNLRLPPWICQPYIRLAPIEHRKLMAEKQKAADDPERRRRVFHDDEGNEISHKLMKKLRRQSRRPNGKGMRCKDERLLPLCANSGECVNPMGIKCGHELCRVCCRDKCHTENVDCEGHKIYNERKKRKTKVSNDAIETKELSEPNV